MKFKVYSFKKINSTNDVAIRKIKQGLSSGIITSEIQKKGRGRHGNNWISKKGNIFLTIFFKISKTKTINILTKENCRIVKKILSKFTNSKIKIKPPNDLLIQNHKVCGILQETYSRNDLKFLILGIGINLINSPIIPQYPTTYLQKYNKKVNKFAIIRSLKNTYENKKNYFKNTN